MKLLQLFLVEDDISALAGVVTAVPVDAAAADADGAYAVDTTLSVVVYTAFVASAVHTASFKTFVGRLASEVYLAAAG